MYDIIRELLLYPGYSFLNLHQLVDPLSIVLRCFRLDSVLDSDTLAGDALEQCEL